MSDLFLSERNLVIITFEIECSQEKIINSIIRRLLKIASKNILPISILILGLGTLDESFMKEIVKSVINSISSIIEKLIRLIDENDNFEDSKFQKKLILSNQINLKEQLMFFKRIINFSSIDLKRNEVNFV
jgi:hypothetical protein